MTRSFKSPKQYVKHDYLPNSAGPKASKKAGFGRFNWGSSRDYIADGVMQVQEEKRDEHLKEREKRREAARRASFSFATVPSLGEESSEIGDRESEGGEEGRRTASASSDSSSVVGP